MMMVLVNNANNVIKHVLHAHKIYVCVFTIESIMELIVIVTKLIGLIILILVIFNVHVNTPNLFYNIIILYY